MSRLFREPKPKLVVLDSVQRRALERLWFIRGNNGPKCTNANHKYIQRFLDSGEDCRKFYKPDRELVKLVKAILEEKA